MSVERLYPTEREAESLAALVPRNNPNLIPLEDFLQRLVVFCQRQDVCNFLFNRDPFQLTHLANPNLVDNCVTGILTSTLVENNTTRYFSHHVRSMFLLAPVFATTNLTFGFGVHEYAYNPAVLWDTLNPGVFGCSLSRFVRDDDTGIMVIAMDMPETDVIQVHFSQLLNTTQQLQSTARFRRRALHAIYEAGTFDITSLTTALESFEASFQVRDCPVCGSTSQCDCCLPRISPRHPFDMTAYYLNMERRLGTFQGLADFSVYQAGRKVHSAPVGSRLTIVGGIDAALINRLQRWAICESASGIDPRHSIMMSNNINSVAGRLPGPCDVDNDQAHRQNDQPCISQDWYGQPRDPQVHVTAEVLDDVSSEGAGMSALTQEFASGRRNVMTDATEASRGATPTAVLNGIPEGPTSSSGSQNTRSSPSTKTDSDDRELVKKLRAELRKERNRASAQRSNLRKKAEADARKLEIKSNKEKASLLRAKEMMLRRENMRLRQQLAEQSETGEIDKEL